MIQLFSNINECEEKTHKDNLQNLSVKHDIDSLVGVFQLQKREMRKFS